MPVSTRKQLRRERIHGGIDEAIGSVLIGFSWATFGASGAVGAGFIARGVQLQKTANSEALNLGVVS